MANTASQLPVACLPTDLTLVELQDMYDDLQDSFFYIDEHQRVLDGLDQYAAVYVPHWTNKDVRERKVYCMTQIVHFKALLEYTAPRLMIGALSHAVVRHIPTKTDVNFIGNFLTCLQKNRHTQLAAAFKRIPLLRRSEHRGLIRSPAQGPGVAPLAYVPCWVCRGPCTHFV
jgi:hypothetical protein